MGLFDKLKASVGIGGATVEVQAPLFVHANSKATVMIAVKGGKLDQVVNGIDLSLIGEHEVEEKDPQTGNTRTRNASFNVVAQRIDSKGDKVAAGGIKSFEVALDVPNVRDAYPNLHDVDFWEISDDADDPARLAADLDEPLPSIDSLPPLTLRASADIPGAVDPAAERNVFIIPTAAGALKNTGRVDNVIAKLQSVGAVRAFAVFKGDQWFAFFTENSARVVATAELRAICSVRPEGVVRTYTNPNVPAASTLGKQPNETTAQREGSLTEARAWAKELGASSTEIDGVLERPIGNAFFGLARLRTI
jgi:hypothetical protein